VDLTQDTQLMTPKQVANTLNMGLSKVYELINSGEIPSVLIGRSLRVVPDQLQRLIAGSAQAQRTPQMTQCAAKECENVFVRSGRQRFCSEACSQRTRSKAQYDRDPEAARRKSAEFYQRKKAQQQLPPAQPTPQMTQCASEGCDETFLKVGRKRFCSATCGQRTWYQRDPEGERKKALLRYHRMKGQQQIALHGKAGREKKNPVEDQAKSVNEDASKKMWEESNTRNFPTKETCSPIYRVKYVFEDGTPNAGYSYHGSRAEANRVLRDWTVLCGDTFAKGILDASFRTKKEILAWLNKHAKHPEAESIGWTRTAKSIDGTYPALSSKDAPKAKRPRGRPRLGTS